MNVQSQGNNINMLLHTYIYATINKQLRPRTCTEPHIDTYAHIPVTKALKDIYGHISMATQVNE